MKTKKPDPARRDHLRRFRETLALLRRWEPDPQALPTKAELRSFEQFYLRGESETQPLLVFRLWADPAPTMATAIRLASESTHADAERSATIARTFLWNPIVPPTDVIGEAGDLLADLFFPGDPVNIRTAEGVWKYGRPLTWDSVWSGLNWWLHTPRGNPRYYKLRRLSLMWRFDPDKVELDENIGQGISVRTLMGSCAHFIEPSGFPGEDTLKRRLATQLREEFERRDLSPPFAIMWQRVQTRSGRAANWDQELKPGKKFYSDLLYRYGALAVHDAQVNASLVGVLIGTMRGLGWVDEVSSQPEGVDLGRHLHPQMFARLGYAKGDRVPAYRVRISTNAEFTDSEQARIHLDFLVPVPSLSGPSKDVPTLLLVPRPDKPYARLGTAYELNMRMLHRVFHRDAGTPLWAYTTCGFVDGSGLKKAEDEEGPGLYKCKYLPLKGEGAALVDDVEHDFPAWAGDPLPPPNWFDPTVKR